ncbi:Uncharacterized protein QTN25_007653 [Entamoeba marina]
MANRSIYSVTSENTSLKATRVEDEDAFDAFDDFDEIEEEPVEEEPVEVPEAVKEEEIVPEEKYEEPAEEENKPVEKETNKSAWCFDDFDGAGSIQPKIYASATSGSNVKVKKQPPPKQHYKTPNSSTKVDWDKYKNSKSISSDQLFGYDEPSEYDKQKLSQYKHSTAIGSDELFGETKQSKSYGMDDEWGEDDVTKLANTIMDGAKSLAKQAKGLFDDF